MRRETTGSYFCYFWLRKGWWGQCLTCGGGRSKYPLLYKDFGQTVQYTVQPLLSVVQAGIALNTSLTRWVGVFPISLLSVVALYPMASKTKQWPIVKNHKGKTTGEGWGEVLFIMQQFPYLYTADNLFKFGELFNVFRAFFVIIKGFYSVYILCTGDPYYVLYTALLIS